METTVKLTPEVSPETMEDRRQGKNIFKMLKKQNYQPRIPCPAKVHCKNKGEMKMFSDKQKLSYFVAPNLTKKKY